MNKAVLIISVDEWVHFVGNVFVPEDALSFENSLKKQFKCEREFNYEVNGVRLVFDNEEDVTWFSLHLHE